MSTAAKLSNRERLRRADEATRLGLHAHLTLLAVLAQCGGEKVVTQGTLEQVQRQLGTLGYEIKPNLNRPNEFIVRLLEGDEDATHENGP